MRVIAALRQRIADFLRERRIARLRAATEAAMLAKDYARAHDLWIAFSAACQARSRGQVDRMERRLGIAPRAALKRSLIDAHCRGLLPAFVVHSAFRVFRLRRL